jgi:capsule polysaccharide modification protein KpsS
LSRNLLSEGLSKHWQPSPAAVAIPAETYIFVPLQLSEDDTIRYHARFGVVEFIDIVAAWARANGVSLLFKLHPHDDDALVRAAVDRWVAEGAHRSAANIHSLIQAARAVYTINSGCGFEALVHGKPVVTFGDCDYANVTFHGHKDNLDEAWKHVLGFAECDAAKAYRWIYFYLERHVIDVRRNDLVSARNLLAAKLNGILFGEN